jgi:hypothetical protein
VPAHGLRDYVWSSERDVAISGSVFDSDHCLLCENVANVCLPSSELVDMVQAHNNIVDSGVHNFQFCRIPVKSGFNVDFLESALIDYEDSSVCEYLAFGWPVNHQGVDIPTSCPRNHSGARFHSKAIDKYIVKEASYGAVLGPFHHNPINTPLALSTLNSVPKKDSADRRVIVDLSFPDGHSINSGVDKDLYLGENVSLTYPRVDDLVAIVKDKGEGCLLFKRDLRRAYRQIPIDPGDVHLFGYVWNNHIIVDRMLTMGLSSAAMICQRTTNAVAYCFRQQGYSVVNYLDDFAGGESADGAETAYVALAVLLVSCGLEE